MIDYILNGNVSKLKEEFNNKILTAIHSKLDEVKCDITKKVYGKKINRDPDDYDAANPDGDENVDESFEDLDLSFLNSRSNPHYILKQKLNYVR